MQLAAPAAIAFSTASIAAVIQHMSAQSDLYAKKARA
jgi:hypothetical protein